MNPFEMVVLIVAISGIASVLRARYGVTRAKHGREAMEPLAGPSGDPEAERLRDEVKSLKERIAVLERLVTDNSRALDLDREIEKLR